MPNRFHGCSLCVCVCVCGEKFMRQSSVAMSEQEQHDKVLTNSLKVRPTLEYYDIKEIHPSPIYMATRNHKSFDLIDSHFWPANYKYFQSFSLFFIL